MERKKGGGFPYTPPQPSGSGEAPQDPLEGSGQSPGRKRISVLYKRYRMPLVEMFQA